MSTLPTPRTAIPLATFLLLAAPAARGATLHYPADYPTIQAAVDAAAFGDTVLVAPGRYQEPIVMKDGIALRATEGPDSTILVNSATEARLVDQRHVIIPEGCGPSTLIEGFFFDSLGRGGRAIQVENAQPTIRGNTFFGWGWGINLESSDALITDNVIQDGTAFGIQVRGSSPRIFRNEIHDLGGTAIAISGKTSRPLIGGSPENANRIYATQFAVENASRRDIDATWNDWGWVTGAEMDDKGYPADILAFVDGNDVGKTHRGRGVVDYRHWATAAAHAAPGEAETETPGTFPALPILVGLGLVVVLVIVARMRRPGRLTGS